LQQFTHEFEKSYDTIEEYTQAFENFKINKNLESRGRKSLSYETGVTKFFDMTLEEFRRTYLNLHVPTVEKFLAQASVYEFPDIKADAAFDWRTKSAVGAVKNQGSCGSCWAFSTVANLEGVYYIKYKVFKSFAEQQLVDCDKQDGACNGGYMETALNYIKSSGGLELQQDYPYKGVLQACQFSASKVAVKVTGYVRPGTTDEGKIRDFLFTVGPLSVALNADPLMTYKSGIIDLTEAQCSPAGMNHAVTLVGYGTENGKDFWIVKNSWGNWGEQGYFRLIRGKGACGINRDVISAVVA